MSQAAPDESDLRAAFDAGDFTGVATGVIERYGDEILRFVATYLRSDADAHDVFGEFSERLWRGLPAFEWRTSLRAWAYTIARNAAIGWKTSAARKPARNLALSEPSVVARAAAATATRTLAHLKTETKDRMRALYDKLLPDDRALLTLRIDRGLSWREVAHVLSPDARRDPSQEEARLRARFRAVKSRLRALAVAEGLIDH